jgi:hypothetical protein
VPGNLPGVQPRSDVDRITDDIESRFACPKHSRDDRTIKRQYRSRFAQTRSLVWTSPTSLIFVSGRQGSLWDQIQIQYVLAECVDINEHHHRQGSLAGQFD